LLSCLVIVLATLAVYCQTWTHGFIIYDDGEYITDNPLVRDGISVAGLKWAVSAVVADLWTPLTTIGHQILCSLPGDSAGNHHLASSLLHALSGILILAISRLMGCPMRVGLLGAMVFLLHPCRIPSVAWAAELKDMLATTFGLGASFCYLRGMRSETRGKFLYTVGLVLFAASLLSKPSWVGLPVVLAAMTFAGTPEYRSWILRLVPHCVFAGVTVVIAMFNGRHHFLLPDFLPPDGMSAIGYSVASLFGLAWRMVDWSGPTFVDRPDQPMVVAMWCGWAFIGLWGIAAIVLRKRQPLVALGLLVFLCFGLPSSGLFPFSRMAMADHYTYMTHLGILLALAPLAMQLAERMKGKVLLPVGVGLALFLGISTTQRVGDWQDSVSFAKSELARDPDNSRALMGLGLSLWREGKVEDSLVVFSKLAATRPLSFNENAAIGEALAAVGDTEGASHYFGNALRYPIHSDGRAHRFLASQAISNGRPEQGLRLLLNAPIRSTEERFVHQLELASVYEKLGMRVHHAEILWKMARDSPDDQFLLVEATAAFAASNRYDVAIRMVEAGISRFPDEQDLAALLAELKANFEGGIVTGRAGLGVWAFEERF